MKYTLIASLLLVSNLYSSTLERVEFENFMCWSIDEPKEALVSCQWVLNEYLVLSG